MTSRANLVCSTAVEFEEQKERGKQPRGGGIESFREALEQDAKEAVARGSGLPEDWRNRVLRW